MEQRKSPQTNIVRCDDAVNFTQIFFNKHDKEKETISSLYHDASTLIWNGQCHKNKTSIARFYQSMKNTQTEPLTIDTQILPQMGDMPDLTTIIVGGKITQNNVTVNFSRTFVLGVQGTSCHIISDTMRHANS